MELAKTLLESGCSWGSELMSKESLREATHRPLETWNPATDGSWWCRHCQKHVWKSWGEVHALEARLAKLRSAVANDDEAAETELNNLLKQHADQHLDMILLAELPAEAGTEVLLVDFLHGLNLNCAKVAWKYSFGDRMLPKQRVQAARYLNSIDVPLDVREKGKREQSQKWFSSSQFDEYMLGSEVRTKSKSPGLAENTWAMVDIVFQPTGATVEAKAAPSPAPSTSQPTKAAPAPSQSRKKRLAPTAGFAASTPQPSSTATDSQPKPPAPKPIQLPKHLQNRRVEAELQQMREFVRQRFGSRAVEAMNSIELWACYGEMYREARDPWTSDTKEYRAKRALRFLRTAVAFGVALATVSDYKHKSWYVHYMVWIVPRMIYLYGDLWRFSTAAIESRNARLKRMGITCISWRPYQEGKSVYHCIDYRTGKEVEREQSYKSCPMEQMLSKVLALQDAWHGDSIFMRPEKLRLQQDLRRKRLKCEFESDVHVGSGLGDMSVVLLGKSQSI
uniref:Uncharacterized protein n=1 Tax=Haptolina brevifila TaxID=156173 RepID=A0A7S2JIX6_9EUKA|mmetsp:Transcript_83616/g.166941  ORF Transcript_83616/g.166941 Transcript_83616/m.166941 type:complete len:507 (+) Transcript_83616:2152-3672(+)